MAKKHQAFVLQLLVANIGASVSIAQTTALPADQGLEEITVTAQRRSEKISDVPLSITAVSRDQLIAAGVSSPQDLESVVPGFTYQRSSYGVPVFSIRGIGFLDTALAVAPTVSVYVDQVPLPFLPMTAAAGLDVDQVEVLKGPQGTLFGANSTGGAINYIAAKPTRQFESGVSASFGRFASFEGEGFVSGPLSDTLTARLAVRSEQSGDWQYNYTRRDSLGARHFTAGRLLLDWDPNDRVHVELNVNGWTDTSDTQAAQFILYSPSVSPGLPAQAAALSVQPKAPNNDRAADWDPGQQLKNDNDFHQFSLNGEFEVSDSIKLNSITQYAGYHQAPLLDPDGSDFNDYRLYKRGSITTWSEELRLSGHLVEDRLTWLTGGNFEHDNTKDDETGDPPFGGSNASIGPLIFKTFRNSTDQSVKTASGFASADFKLTDTLTAQASGRYTNEDRDLSACLEDVDGTLANAFNLLHSLIGVTGTIPQGGCATYNSVTDSTIPDRYTTNFREHNVSWRGGLSWKPTSNALIYGNVTQGFKGGAFPTTSAIASVEYTPVVQESVRAFELGSKVSLFNRTLELTDAVYHYEYKNKQILGFYESAVFGSLPALVNIPKSRVDGAEVELAWRPILSTRLSAGVEFVDSKVTSNFTTADPFGHALDIEGEAFPNTPKWQFNGGAEYRFPLQAVTGFVGSNYRYRTAASAQFGDSPLFRIDSYGILDLRAGIESLDEKWKLELWGRNVTDKYYWNNVSHLVDTVARTAGMPATFGIRADFHF